MRAISFFISFLCLCGHLSAQDPCSEEFQKNPFPPDVVNQVLEQFRVSPSEWVGINRALERQVALSEVRVQQRAAKLERNPFNPPQQKVVIGKLYREVLIEGFGFVMRQHGIKKTRQIYDMFDAIQDEKAERIWECLRE